MPEPWDGGMFSMPTCPRLVPNVFLSTVSLPSTHTLSLPFVVSVWSKVQVTRLPKSFHIHLHEEQQ